MVSDMITDMDANRFVTYSLNDPRILHVLAAALEAVDPFKAVQRHLPKMEGQVFGLGIGKAAIPMMDALVERIPLAGGLAVTKFASGASRTYTVLEGGHPVPDARSMAAGHRVLEFVSHLKEHDTLVCLISGGGSALVTVPYVPLEDLQTLTSVLLSSGARIDEINTLRRQLDRIKGGGLARATKAKIISLILSDVIGNPLESIASGPTAPDPTTSKDALHILKKYGLKAQVPASILAYLENDSLIARYQEQAPEFQTVQNIIVGDNKLAAQAALEQAEREGFQAEILTNELQGEAREAGRELARLLRADRAVRRRSFCLIAGGETTVTLRRGSGPALEGDGKGGRNQELALGAVEELRGLESVMLIALGTDGDDGPTDAAGAIATGETAGRAESLGLDAADSLSRNDAYPFFEALADLLKTGPTGTNVNDLIFLVAI
jgi:hydroxypyruvate reductase